MGKFPSWGIDRIGGTFLKTSSHPHPGSAVGWAGGAGGVTPESIRTTPGAAGSSGRVGPTTGPTNPMVPTTITVSQRTADDMTPFLGNGRRLVREPPRTLFGRRARWDG